MIVRLLISFVALLSLLSTSIVDRIVNGEPEARITEEVQVEIPSPTSEATTSPKVVSEEVTKKPESPKNEVAKAPLKKPTTPAPKPIGEIIPNLPVQIPKPPTKQLTSDEVYQLLDTAVVQIICYLNDRILVAGSGIVVSEDGVVLTNAHVVEGTKNCSVRTGNPAITSGDFEILYVGNTEKKIGDSDVPEEDFALGRIVRPTGTFSIPYKYLTLNTAYEPQVGDRYFLAAYSSEFLGGSGFRSGNQNLVFTTTELLGFFSFGEATREVLELKGNISTQEGASGSPIISPFDGSVVGLVFGQDKGPEGESSGTNERTEFAFSISYVDRLVRKAKGVGLHDFIESLGQ